MISALYAGRVVHQRTRPRRHRLEYRVFTLLLDLDELPALDKRLRLFGYNRRAPLSFHDKDHGDGSADGLRAWVEGHLAEAGLAPDGGGIRLLCYPRLFGYVFNPLSVFFCYDRGGALVATLYEVHNTHGERHTYVMPVGQHGAAERGVLEQSCAKRFYVSPFVPMECFYRFRIVLPGERVGVSIGEDDIEGRFLTATFHGRRRKLGDRVLARALLGYPLMTLKVFAGIRWEALRLRLKRLPWFDHAPAAEKIGRTIVPAGETTKQV